jgi:uncharacterized protein (TIGR00369 family)
MDATPDGWEPRYFGLPDGYSALIGPLLTRRDAQGWASGVVVEAKHLNARGVVHGGLIASLADNALGMLVWETLDRKPCATVQLNVQYVAAGREGDFLVVRGEIVRATRSVVFVRGLVTAEERTIAMADGVWKRLGSP